MKAIYVICFCIAICGQTANAETKRALLVGISDYGNSTEEPYKWNNINGANDIRLLAPLFKEQGFYVKSIVDGQATHSGIVKALDKLAKASKKGDLVYVHFSMHGQPFEDLNGDEEDGWDEALIPVDAEMIYKEGIYEGQNHLLDDELEVYFNNIRAKIGPEGHLYVILDACHSGTASRGDDDHIRGTREGFTRSGKEYEPDRTKETNDYFQVPTADGQSPIIILEACRSYQVNHEYFDDVDKVVYGSLSYYISQAIKSGEVIGSEEWIDFIKNGMKNSKKRSIRRQNLVIEKSE